MRSVVSARATGGRRRPPTAASCPSSQRRARAKRRRVAECSPWCGLVAGSGTCLRLDVPGLGLRPSLRPRAAWCAPCCGARRSPERPRRRRAHDAQHLRSRHVQRRCASMEPTLPDPYLASRISTTLGAPRVEQRRRPAARGRAIAAGESSEADLRHQAVGQRRGAPGTAGARCATMAAGPARPARHRLRLRARAPAARVAESESPRARPGHGDGRRPGAAGRRALL